MTGVCRRTSRSRASSARSPTRSTSPRASRAGHAVRSCMIGMRIAEELRLPARVRSDLFYALLLKDAGCSANAERMAALFGADDQLAKRTSKLIDWSSPARALVWSLRTVAPGGSLRDRAAYLKGISDEGDVTRKFMEARCDRGAEIARMLYLSEETAAAIRSLDEHWDGRGMPDGLRGRGDPAARAHPLPRADGRDLPRRRRRRGRARRRAAPPRALVRPGARRRAARRLPRPRVLAHARAIPTCRAGSRPSCCCAPTTRASTGSPRRSRA